MSQSFLRDPDQPDQLSLKFLKIIKKSDPIISEEITPTTK